MANDYDCYRVRHGDRHSTADGTAWGAAGRRWSRCRVYWAMDDWPHFEPGPGRSGLARAVEPSSRSGPRSSATPTSTRPAAWSWSPSTPSASVAATGWRCSNASSTPRRRSMASSSNGSTPSSTAGRRRPSLTIGERPGRTDRVEHRRRQSAGERVLLARVVRCRAARTARRPPPPRARTAASAAPRDPVVASARSPASQPNAPSATMTRTSVSSASSRARNGAHVSRSSIVGLLAGGAQRTAAAMYVSVSVSRRRRAATRPDRPDPPGGARPTGNRPTRHR